MGHARICFTGIVHLYRPSVYNKPFPGPIPAKGPANTCPQEIHSVKEHIEELLAQSLLHLQREGVLPNEAEPTIQLERTRSPEHGEFATNLAMSLSKAAGMPPRELAQAIIDHMPRSRQVDRLEIAGPGFVNFFSTAAP